MRVSIISLVGVAALASACNDAQIIEVDQDTTVVCTLEDCSEWEAPLVVDAIEDYKRHWQALFPDDKFVAPEVINVDAQLACLDFCGGYANGKEISVQGMLESFRMPIHMTRFDHEMTHNALRANTGDGDMNHAEPGGPWNGQHDRLVNVMEHKACDAWEEFGTPCDD